MNGLSPWEHAQALNLNEDILHEAAMALNADITKTQEEDAVRRLAEAAKAVYESKPPAIAAILRQEGKLS